MPKRGERWTILDHAKEDDDILSYLFVDLGFFRKQHDKERRISRKFNREEFRTQPSVNWDAYLSIIWQVNAGDITPKEGCLKLMNKGTLRTLLAKKRGQEEYNHFVHHVERYMELWKPECPFKLFQTKRFMNPKPVKGKSVAPVVPSSPAVASPTSIKAGQDDAAAGSSTTTLPDAGSVQSSPQPDSRASTPTAKQSKFGPPLDLGVKSLKAFKVHETLRLYGSGVNLSAEENEAMQLDDSQLKADFSVLWSLQKNCYQLFLGPGRFVNHDCNPNVELMRSGRGLCFKVVREIEVNDELLFYYGDNYFGKDNESCLCMTCKKNRKGAYTRPEKVGKKVKAQDPNARQTRSGRQPISLQKKVHKANLARTTITLTQGTRRSERSVTQIASTSSLEKARKSLRQSSGTAGGRKRKRSDSSSSEEDEDVSYGARRRSRTKTSKKTKQRQSAGSDSSLTDVETLGRSVALETSSSLQDGSVEDNMVLPPSSAVAEATFAMFSTAMAEGAEPVIQETATGDATTSSSVEGPASKHQHAAMPQPDFSSIAEDAETLSQVTSTNDAVVTSTPGTPPTTGSTFGIQLAALAGSAKAIFFRGLQGASENPAPIASDTASQSQSSVFDQDEEQKN